MTKDELRVLINRFDSEIPREGASASWFYESYFDAIVVRATERGYLRLGTEFLKAAFAERRQGDCVSDRSELDVDIRYVLSGAHSVQPLHFNRDESLREPEPIHPKTSILTRVSGWIAGLVMLLIAVLITILIVYVVYAAPLGLLAVVDWIAGLF